MFFLAFEDFLKKDELFFGLCEDDPFVKWTFT